MHHCATLVALPENEVKGLLHAVVREIVQLKVIAYIFFLEDNTNFIIPYNHYLLVRAIAAHGNVRVPVILFFLFECTLNYNLATFQSREW